MTGFSSIDTLGTWIMWLASVSAGFAVLWRILRSVVRIAAQVDAMWDDWQGIPGTPGVMERLRSIEDKLKSYEEHHR